MKQRMQTVPKLTTEFADISVGLLIYADCINSVLMDGLQLSISLGLSLEIHLTEQIQSRLLANSTDTRTGLVFDSSCKLPSVLISMEAVRLAILLE